MTDHHAFRRGAHAAVQSIVDDFSGLVQRRMAASSPEQMTHVIIAMTKRIAERPYPTEDPGPADPLHPDTPAEPRPTTEMLLAVACLAAEESGLPIQVTVTSDGLQVYGTNAGRTAVRGVSWREITTSELPVLSLAVQAVIEELRQ